MKEKEITFAGSVVGEPWWTLGEIVAKILEPRGYKVKISHESFAENNIRWITSGRAQIGATTPHLLKTAIKGINEFKGEIHKDLTCIATVRRPNWIALAVKHETGITDLRDVKKRKYPLRIVAQNIGKGSILDTVLGHHGITLEEIEAWGGRAVKWSTRLLGKGYIREEMMDMMLGNIYLGYTPHTSFWYDATVLHDMRFLSFDEALIKKLMSKYGYTRSTLPHGLFRGVDRDIPTVTNESICIYCLKDQPEALVRLIAEELDKNSDLFKCARSVFYYEREEVWKSPVVPLHPAAEEYYQEKGYIR